MQRISIRSIKLYFEMEKNQQNQHNGRWTESEHEMFLQGLQIHGKNWKKIEQLVGSRTGSQIRSHAQKYFLKCNAKTPETIENNQRQFIDTYNVNNHDSSMNNENLSAAEKQIQNIDNQTEYSYLCKQLNRYSKNISHFGDEDRQKPFDFWNNCIQISLHSARKFSDSDVSHDGTDINSKVQPCRLYSFVPIEINNCLKLHKIQRFRQLK